MVRVIAALLVAILAVPTGALAQAAQAPTAEPSPGRSTEPQPSAESATTVDASKMGVDLSRIKRELVQADEAEESDSPLRLRFTVQVVGVAPKIDLLEGFKLSGAIPYGAPTHQEILEVFTPQAYRSPTIPFSALAVLAAQKLSQYSNKRRCEEELEAYRQLVMQGVAVSAPRCKP